MIKISATIIIPLGILLGFQGVSHAQKDSLFVPRGTKNYGYIITLEGDTVPGYILNLNLWNNQMMTFYFKDLADGDKGTKYRGKDLLGYQAGPRIYERLKFSGLYSPYRYNFFLRKQDGAIDYFIWYYNNDVNKLSGSDALLTEASDAFLIDEEELWVESIGRTQDGKIIEFGTMRFRMKFSKNMSKLVRDDHELAKKILQKQEGYRFSDLEKIIREYNDWKAGQ